jgi:prefoldin subunit 5
MGSGIMPQALSSEQEIEMLKNQAQAVAQQLKEIQRRIAELEKGK